MNAATPLPVDRAAALRRAFDRSFAEARQPDPPPSDDLLAIRLGSQPYALRLSELAGLFAGQKITPLPSRVPALLGLAAFRGAILPVYDLNRLLGHTPAESARWLVIAAAAPVAFAFTAMDGSARLPREAIVPAAAAPDDRKYVREVARAPALVRPIVHLSSVLAAIRQQSSENTKTEAC